MLDTLLMLTLAPLLVWQGRQVRQRTVRLPEAAGAREGRQGQGLPLRILILGDSSAAGVGVSRQEDALAGQLAAHLSGEYQVSWLLVAESGITSAQLLNKLDAVLRQQFDCAVVAVGVNDVTARTQDKLWLSQLQRLRERLRVDFQVQHIFFSAIPPMQHFTALPRPLSDFLGRRAQRLNSLTNIMAQQCEDLSFVPITLSAQPQMLAADGFHPNQQAYRLWAEQLAMGIKEILVEPRLSNK